MDGLSNRHRENFGIRRLSYYAETIRLTYRSLGLKMTLRLCAAELLFDVTHRTETFMARDLRRATDLVGDSRAAAEPYEGVNPLVCRFALAEVRHPPAQGCLVDYGCGKGRALIVGIERGFGRAIGIEFSADLCKRARKNLARYSRVEILNVDAATWDPPAAATVFYFFNPFGPSVLTPVLARVRASLIQTPRQHHLIYINPLHHEEVLRAGFREQRTRDGERFDYKMYSIAR